MKKNVLLIIAILFTNAITLAQTGKLLREAKNTTDLNKQIALCNQVIALDSKNLDAYFLRGLAKNDLGDFHGAIVDYSKIILLKPDADTYFNRGNSRYNLQDFEGAKDDFMKAFKLDPYFVDALYSLAHTQVDLEDYQNAIKSINAFISLVPDQAKGYTLRALIFAETNNHKSAIADYSMAILVAPSVESYLNRGIYYLSINYYKNANADFKTVLRSDKTNSFAYFYRGTSGLLLGKYTNAINDFKKAIKFDASDFDAMLGLALSYYKAKDIPNAKLYYNKAAQIISPNNPINNVSAFENSYWYTNEYYFFVNIYNDLSKL